MNIVKERKQVRGVPIERKINTNPRKTKDEYKSTGTLEKPKEVKKKKSSKKKGPNKRTDRDAENVRGISSRLPTSPSKRSDDSNSRTTTDKSTGGNLEPITVESSIDKED